MFYIFMTKKDDFGISTGLADCAMAAAGGAHGFTVSQLRGSTVGSDRPTSVGSALWMWFKKFIGVAFIASMIGIGTLLYNHFSKKWESTGLPSMPIAAMQSVAKIIENKQPGQPGSSGTAGVLGGPSSVNSGGQTTLKWDEYRG